MFVLLLAPFFLVPLGCTLDQSSHLLTHSCLSLVTTPSQFLASVWVPTLLHFLISVFACALPMFYHPSLSLRECPCCFVTGTGLGEREKKKQKTCPHQSILVANLASSFSMLIEESKALKEPFQTPVSYS